MLSDISSDTTIRLYQKCCGVVKDNSLFFTLSRKSVTASGRLRRAGNLHQENPLPRQVGRGVRITYIKKIRFCVRSGAACGPLTLHSLAPRVCDRHYLPCCDHSRIFWDSPCAVAVGITYRASKHMYSCDVDSIKGFLAQALSRYGALRRFLTSRKS